MYWIEQFLFSHGVLSMVVDDFDVRCVTIAPPEANPPLVVDSDCVLSFTAAFQRFQPVSRWNPQILQSAGPV